MRYMTILVGFVSFIMLLGCAPAQTYTPPKAPGPVATGSFRDMEWNCEETDINDVLVWVRCEFRNNAPPIKEVCIKVVYDNIAESKEVVESRELCSGPLWSGGTYENYAAFFRESRKTLADGCGPKLEKCRMATKISSSSYGVPSSPR